MAQTEKKPAHEVILGLLSVSASQEVSSSTECAVVLGRVSALVDVLREMTIPGKEANTIIVRLRRIRSGVKLAELEIHRLADLLESEAAALQAQPK